MEEWMEQAACRDHDPDLWFPLQGDRAYPARRICSGCPVQVECLDFALRMEDKNSLDNRLGIWGGRSPRERVQMIGSRLNAACEWCEMRFERRRPGNRFCSVGCRTASTNSRRRVV